MWYTTVMSFTATYRDRTGHLVTETLEARDRGDALAQLNARGFQPTSLKPTRGAAASTATARPPWLRGLVAGLIVIAAALGAWFLLAPAPDTAKPAPTTAKQKAKPRTPATRPSKAKDASAPAARPAKPAEQEKAPPAAKVEDTWLGVAVDHREVVTNGTLVNEKIYTKDGKTHRFFHDLRPPVFENASDQILALATADSDGFGMPPLPSLSNFKEEFLKSLQKPVTIKPDDPDDVKALKERIMQARAEMVDAMAAGMEPEEVLAEHQRKVEDDAALRLEAVQAVRKMLDAGDEQGAEELCSRFNEALEEMGVMTIEIPRKRNAPRNNN